MQKMQECPEMQERLRELSSKYEPAPVYRYRTPTREIEWYPDGGAGIKRLKSCMKQRPETGGYDPYNANANGGPHNANGGPHNAVPEMSKT